MKLNKEILRLAGPSILANITVPMVGMVDIAVVGHLGASGGISGAAFIGGISVGTMLFDLLYWSFAFLRAGTGGLTAQAYGKALFGKADARTGAKSPLSAPGKAEKELSGAKSASFAPGNSAGKAIAGILGRALRIAWVSGLALIALQWVVVQLAFLVVNCSPEVQQLATRYFYIRIWAAPATLSLFAMKGWFIGLQDSLRPMLVDLWVNLCNIMLSLGLGFGLRLPASGLPSGTLVLLPELGFAGVAWGTVIAQWTGFLLALALARKYLSINNLLKILGAKGAEDYQQNADTEVLGDQPSEGLRGVSASEGPRGASAGLGPRRTEADQGQAIGSKAFFSLNRDLFLRSVGMIAVYIGFTVLSARLGDLMLAVSTILMKMLMLFSYFTDGFAYAGEALTGRFIGERSRDGVRSTVRGTFAWSFGLALAFMLLYGAGGVPLLHLMTSDASVVEAGKAYIPWLLLMPLIGCPAFNWDGIFIGATASRDLRNSTLLCAAGFFAVWLAGRWILGAGMSQETGLHLLMAAYFTHLAIRGLYLSVRYKSAIRQSGH